MCACVFVCECVHVYLYVCLYAHGVCAHVGLYVCVHVRMWRYVWAWMCLCGKVFFDVHVYVLMRLCVNVCLYFI